MNHQQKRVRANTHTHHATPRLYLQPADNVATCVVILTCSVSWQMFALYRAMNKCKPTSFHCAIGNISIGVGLARSLVLHTLIV